MPLILPCCSRLLWAPGDEIRTHPGLPDHCLQCFPHPQHGHVRLGAQESPAGQARQGQCLDLWPQWPVTVAAGKVSRALSQVFVFWFSFAPTFFCFIFKFFCFAILTLPRVNDGALKAQQIFITSLFSHLQKTLLKDASTSPNFPL